MARPLSILLVVWSLVATPVLCRAGVRLGCCDTTVSRSAMPVDHADTDCERDHCPKSNRPASPAEHDEPPPAPLDDVPCDSCSGVCSPVARPLDHCASAAFAHVAVPLIAAVVHHDDHSGAQTGIVRGESPLLPHRPFPGSDIPLLI